MNIEKKAILLFELGHLQVFHYQTQEEWARNLSPYQVYWQKKGEPGIYGPFQDTFTAVKHYTETISPKSPSNIIHVDFKNKRKIK